MKFGLTEEQYEFISTHVVKPLQDLGAEVWCYGSRARNDHQQFSDLDLMVESSENNLDLLKTISTISEFLVESNFPYKVDLVEFSQFAESYKENYFKEKTRF